MNSQKVRYLKASYYRDLLLDLGDDTLRKKYINETINLNDQHIFEDENLEINLPTLTNTGDIGKDDSDNAIKLHQNIKGLTIEFLIDRHFWSYLTHFVYSDYMDKRWNLNTESSIGRIKERYFGYISGDRGLVRNGISRLWWGAEKSVITNNKEEQFYKQNDPYHYTRILFTSQDLYSSILETSYGRNKSNILATLHFVEQKNLYRKLNAQNLTKNIRAIMRSSKLESLNPDETFEKLGT